MSKKMGRPKIKIDEVEFGKLCSLHCTKDEIAGFFNCSEDTIDRWCHATYGESFAVVFKQKRAPGRVSLRRTQYAMAKTNPTMAIWLGKQWLGQREQTEVAVTSMDESMLEMEEYFAKQKRDTKPTME